MDLDTVDYNDLTPTEAWNDGFLEGTIPKYDVTFEISEHDQHLSV